MYNAITTRVRKGETETLDQRVLRKYRTDLYAPLKEQEDIARQPVVGRRGMEFGAKLQGMRATVKHHLDRSPMAYARETFDIISSQRSVTPEAIEAGRKSFRAAVNAYTSFTETNPRYTYAVALGNALKEAAVEAGTRLGQVGYKQYKKLDRMIEERNNNPSQGGKGDDFDI